MIDQYPSANGVLTSLIWRKTAAGGETSLSGYDDASQALSYTPGQEQVYLNGILLVRGDDYTATNGTSITGLTALAANDFVQINCYNNFSVASVPSTSITGTITNSQLAGSISNDKLSNSSITINGSPVSLGGSVSLAGDIESVAAGTGLTGGGTSGSVTLNLDTTSAYVVPSQTGNSGKYLTTNGTSSSWAAVDALPSQTGNSGKYLTTNGTTASWGTVNQPITWTPRLESSSTGFYGIAYNGSNLYVAVGSAGTLYTSPDALTWTSRTSGFGSNAIYGVGYGNGLFVAVGASGTLTTSTDGITWTARTSNMGANSITSVKYDNSIWVAVGEGGGTTNTGGIIYSTDGITWTRKSQSLTVGAYYYDVVWNGTNWIVGAEFNTNNYLYASTPSGTWTAGATGSGGSVVSIKWDGTRHIVHESSSYITRYSTSTTLGTTTQYTNTHRGEYAEPGPYFYYNNRMYVSNSRYIGSFIPASSASVTNYPAQLLPVTTGPAGNAFLNGGQYCIFVNASGIIFASVFGIFTSF
jgi:hypothetical protein